MATKQLRENRCSCIKRGSANPEGSSGAPGLLCKRPATSIADLFFTRVNTVPFGSNVSVMRSPSFIRTPPASTVAHEIMSGRWHLAAARLALTVHNRQLVTAGTDIWHGNLRCVSDNARRNVVVQLSLVNTTEWFGGRRAAARIDARHVECCREHGRQGSQATTLSLMNDPQSAPEPPGRSYVPTPSFHSSIGSWCKPGYADYRGEA
jgi:hypothetical protein